MLSYNNMPLIIDYRKMFFIWIYVTEREREREYSVQSNDVEFMSNELVVSKIE